MFQPFHTQGDAMGHQWNICHDRFEVPGEEPCGKTGHLCRRQSTLWCHCVVLGRLRASTEGSR